MALSWLVTTAAHEALKLVQRAGSELSFETAIDQGLQLPASPVNRSPAALAEARERLGSLGRLSERQQRFLWLYGLGLSYQEIARMQGCTSRTVERQLQNARASLHERVTP